VYHFSNINTIENCSKYSRSNALGFKLLSICFLTLSIAVISSQLNLVVSSFVLGLFLSQCFFLLHEAGHGTLFQNAHLNKMVGQIFGIVCFLPFSSWQHIHAQHHVWAGWRNVDPTTVAIAQKKPNYAEKIILEVCRLLLIPLPAVVYRFSIFWNSSRLSAQTYKKTLLIQKIKREKIAIVTVWSAACFCFYQAQFLFAFFCSVWLSLIFTQFLTLSQHSFIPQTLHSNTQVKPVPYSAEEQARLSRSLRFPKLFSSLVTFGFEHHELHHQFPKIPSAILGKLSFDAPNSLTVIQYLKKYLCLPQWKFVYLNSQSVSLSAKEPLSVALPNREENLLKCELGALNQSPKE
jgi:acyl-lipid omega-6 desaturase (Delta-12 desaturase)